MRSWIVSSLVLAAATAAWGQSAPSADSILATAKSDAQASHRTIFTIFHASW